MVDSDFPHLEDLAKELAELNPPLGKYAVLGNHEYYWKEPASLAFINSPASGFFAKTQPISLQPSFSPALTTGRAATRTRTALTMRTELLTRRHWSGCGLGATGQACTDGDERHAPEGWDSDPGCRRTVGRGQSGNLRWAVPCGRGDKARRLSREHQTLAPGAWIVSANLRHLVLLPSGWR
jgi:hypothetical protein